MSDEREITPCAYVALWQNMAGINAFHSSREVAPGVRLDPNQDGQVIAVEIVGVVSVSVRGKVLV